MRSEKQTDIPEPDACVVHLYGPRRSIAAALYLSALSPGPYLNEGSSGHLIGDGGVPIDPLADDARTQQILSDLVVPAATLGWASPGGERPPHKVAERITIRRLLLAPQAPVGIEIGLSALGTRPQKSLTDQVESWSARCKNVMFVVTEGAPMDRFHSVRGIFRGERALPDQLVERQTPEGEPDPMLPERLKKAVLQMQNAHRWDPSKDVLEATDDLYATVGRQGPRGLVAMLDTDFADYRNEMSDPHDWRLSLTRMRPEGLTLIDWAIRTDTSDFLHPGAKLAGPDTVTSVNQGVPEAYRGNARLGANKPDALAGLAPRVSVKRIAELCNLCADNKALAEFVGSELGRTANGLHVVALMARHAAPRSNESEGVAAVMRAATLVLPRYPEYQHQEGPVRTAGALMESGNAYAWRFLSYRWFDPHLNGHAAACALRTLRDTKVYIEEFGSHLLRQNIERRAPVLLPLFDLRMSEIQAAPPEPEPPKPIPRRRPSMR